MWDSLRYDIWCRRDSVKAHKSFIQPVPVRRSRRQLLRPTKLGVFEDSDEMEGQEESATTNTSFDYSPGKT